MNNDIVILGAGVAGLSAGIYALRAGYAATIYEMGATPGGLCTTWSRKGYHFDGLAAGLAGTSPEVGVWQLWKDLGVVDGCPLHNPENFGTVLLPSGRKVVIHTDVERLERELLSHFAGDRKPILRFLAALKALRWMEIPFSPAQGQGKAKPLRNTLRSLGGLPEALGFGSLSLRRFVEGLKDPECRLVFSNLVHFGGLDVPLLSVLLPLAYAGRQMTGIPREGWLSFSRVLESQFTRLGGRILYRKKAVGLLRAGNSVAGVRFADGSRVEAPRVLSAVDGRFTELTLLGSVGIEPTRIPTVDQLSDQPVQVSLGLDLDPKEFSGAVTLVLPGEEWVAGSEQRTLTFHANHHNDQAAPRGKAAVIVFLASNTPFWDTLGRESVGYEREKNRCLDWVLGHLEGAIPGARSLVEVADVATPLTRERYTGNWRGAMQARKAGTGVVRALLSPPVRYGHRRLRGFYSAGQWVEAWGGITTAALSGRNAIRALCRRDGVGFR